MLFETIFVGKVLLQNNLFWGQERPLCYLTSFYYINVLFLSLGIKCDIRKFFNNNHKNLPNFKINVLFIIFSIISDKKISNENQNTLRSLKCIQSVKSVFNNYFNIDPLRNFIRGFLYLFTPIWNKTNFTMCIFQTNLYGKFGVEPGGGGVAQSTFVDTLTVLNNN